MTAVRSSSDPLAQLLRGEWTDPDSGAATGIDIAAIAIEDNLRGCEAALVSELRLGRRLAVVSDAVTHEVLGARVEQSLAKVARGESGVLARTRHAHLPTVNAAH